MGVPPGDVIGTFGRYRRRPGSGKKNPDGKNSPSLVMKRNAIPGMVVGSLFF
jgi:hypothetical protein